MPKIQPYVAKKLGGGNVCLHKGLPYVDQIICKNCNGNHFAQSINCPIHKKDFEIQSIKAKENISYFEARKKVKIPTATAGTLHAAATSLVPKSNVNELVPQLIEALRHVFVMKSDVSRSGEIDVDMSPLMIGPRRGGVESALEPIYAASATESEERTRDSSTESDFSNSQLSIKPKKQKKGWPKGKPRLHD
ncbi:hypothetical protein HHI36_001453 [Cryptolaemus montrouzieri]|uniref:Uncharacterized protein n=1 Tax=Cryptolaemus montrouzieri TaxID=559131 RepID=A0ABD2P889_9CUCU